MKETINRTTQSLQAMQAAQASARALAASGANNLGVNPNEPGQALPDVPNGLQPGGLVPYSGGVWTGANLPVQSSSGGQTLVNIQQNAAQALLTWQKFNIGKDTTLNFDQSAGGVDATQWIAFNKINDPSGVPSQILGTIKAQGQVYVINQNGIIFGGNSQVNTHALVASSLPINDNLIARGLLNQQSKDVQFLFSAGPVPSGDVTVQPGAQLSSPTSSAKVGGRIALIGPNVTNGGTISTPDGQTILAAGNEVGFVAHNTSDPTLRGLDVVVGTVDPGSGNVTNSGLIDAPRGGVTVVGKNVNQLGVLESSTSVALNGRFDLSASYGTVANADYDATLVGSELFFPQTTGSVFFGPNSQTRILPEWASDEKVVGTELSLQSQINLRGLTVQMAPGSAILAPNAQVGLNAGIWAPASDSPLSQFVYSGGQIYLDEGASIDVAGSVDVSVPVSRNLLTLQLRGAELADYPLQRSGVIRGETITVDIRNQGTTNGMAWIGTPLGDASGFVGITQRSVGELTIAGGTVSMKAGDSVVMRPGSKVDVSGGAINFEGGMVQTTRVLYRGRSLDISSATPNRVYDGIDNGSSTEHPKWGVTENWGETLAGRERFEKGYIQGADGGSIEIFAPTMALDGVLLGQTLRGPRQRDGALRLSELSLNFEAQDTTFPYMSISPVPPKITFETGVSQSPAEPFALDASGNPLALREDRQDLVVMSPNLLGPDGFGKLTINNGDGDILVPQDVKLAAPAYGSVVLGAGNVDIQGQVTAPSGNLNFTVYNFSPYEAVPQSDVPIADTGRGKFTLGSGAVLSTAGVIVDERGSGPRDTILALEGGNISIRSFNAELSSGSVVDVSGGFVVGGNGVRTFGNGGNISVRAGQDPRVASIFGGDLVLGSTLNGYSGNKGGSLSMQASLVQIGGQSSLPNTLMLDPKFFSTGGFASFSLTGLGAQAAQPEEYIPGVVIAPGTSIEPLVESWTIRPSSVGSEALALSPVVKPEGLRNPVSLTFKAPGVTDPQGVLLVRGDLSIGERAVVQAGAKGRVTIQGQTVSILGAVLSPGGDISVTGAARLPSLDSVPTNAFSTVYLGSESLLSTAGATLLTPSNYGFRTGVVLPGGSVSVSGNILADVGGLIDVSGSSGVLDLLPAQVRGDSGGKFTGPVKRVVLPTLVESDGGSVALTGGQQLFVGSTLLGKAGGVTALGGSLNVSSGRFYAPGIFSTPSDYTLEVTQETEGWVPVSPGLGETGIGKPTLARSGVSLTPQGHFGVDRFSAGGFDSLTLGGNIQFTGPVAIQARQTLSVAGGGVLFADSNLDLKAARVSLGRNFQLPVSDGQLVAPFLDSNGNNFYIPPTFGPGILTVEAPLIDIGNLTLQNVGRAGFIADQGDIRGDGSLVVAGDIYLRAAQIYPPSASRFSIAAYDYQKDGLDRFGSVTVAASGLRALPLSAGGKLSIQGSIIRQEGTLRAPLGTIEIGWEDAATAPRNLLSGLNAPVTQQVVFGQGSMTSVSAVDPVTGQGILIPYGISSNGSNWIDPAGNDISSGNVPSKKINVAGKNVEVDQGATLDISGGGDLYAYQFVKGNGGSTDILNWNLKGSWRAGSSQQESEIVSYQGKFWYARTNIDADANSDAPVAGSLWKQVFESFAVIPGYQAEFSPYAPFNLGTDPGYVHQGLEVGDRVRLEASGDLAAGFYTLLPARYALLPGSVLVTPQASGAALGNFMLADGSELVSGYRFNSLNQERQVSPLYTSFELLSGKDVRERAKYEDFSANNFLKDRAVALGLVAPRLPNDAGHLVLEASESMVLNGRVAARSGDPQSRGGLVDIASSSDILIGGSGVKNISGVLTLDASALSSFGADSLLVGGIRSFGSKGTSVTVTSGALTLDNAGSALSSPEVILVAKENLTLASGAELSQAGSLLGSADTMLFGDSDIPGSGDGLVVRVNSDPAAVIAREGLGSGSTLLEIASGARVSGSSITLDSSAGFTLDPGAVLNGQALSLGSGRISINMGSGGALPADAGLVLSGSFFQGIENVTQSLSLLSYSAIDIYGAGSIGSLSTLENLALHTAEIRGFDNGGGVASFNADVINLDNSPNGSRPGANGTLAGTLEFNAGQINLGVNRMDIDQYTDVALNASRGIRVDGSGELRAQENLATITPSISATASATQAITAGGRLSIQGSSGDSSLDAGLGASLKLEGAQVSINSDVRLPSGLLSVHATSGDIEIGSRLDVGGTSQTLFDVTRYTNAGQVSLTSDTGSVRLLSGGVISVAAAAEGGNAGELAIRTPGGSFSLGGEILGSAGANGSGGTFSLDTQSLADFGGLASTLGQAGFTQEQAFRVRAGNILVDGTTSVGSFSLSADQGSITVSGKIDASGLTGGKIDLIAGGDLTLLPGSELSVAATEFSNAGKGGSVVLETRGLNGGTIDLQVGSIIDLTVAAVDGITDPLLHAQALVQAQAMGLFTGKLHLRAPQNAGGTDLQVDAIAGTIRGGSSISVEGYRIYDLTSSGGTITTAIRNGVSANGATFGGNSAAITARLLAGNPAVEPIFSVLTGAEIINQSGNLTLGTVSSTSTSDWNLANFRFGPKNAPGVLTLRAAGNLVFLNALSDGFVTSAYDAFLLSPNAALPANAQSWSYHLTSGADFTAADSSRVLSLLELGDITPDPSDDTGSLLLGKNGGLNLPPTSGANARTRSAVEPRFQVIRTGSGDIKISAGRNVELRNQFANIYTAGTQVSDPTLGGTFDLPRTNLQSVSTLGLGSNQQLTPQPQYSLAGGDVMLFAQGDIARLTRDINGNLILDSQKQLPNNWLYRRGYVDPTTGNFGVSNFRNNPIFPEIASTTWWVDFSNFFEGVGALGGGNVTLTAGQNIINVDGLVPTNARMPGKDTSGNAIAPAAANLVELGGGNLVVQAGNNIDGGVYYVERGSGTLNAGGEIKTNSARSPSLQNLTSPGAFLAEESWLPTTLFLGKGSFDVNARGDLLLGPVANPFLLPQGFSNTFRYKTYFSTYTTENEVNVTSLGGSVSLRESVTLPANGSVGIAEPVLQAWMSQVLLFGNNSVSFFQPWLRLSESSVSEFSSAFSLMPATLRASAFSGDINVTGSFSMAPSPTGTVELLAGGSVNGLQVNGTTTVGGETVRIWDSARVNLSDADSELIYGVATPFATTGQGANTTVSQVLNFLETLLGESGSTEGTFGVSQTKQLLHGSRLLHANDPEPVRLYAGKGNIADLTLFTGKSARVLAGTDISDVGFYLQNVKASDISVVSAGRDILAYNANSLLRSEATSSGNYIEGTVLQSGFFPDSESGDIQISGPGTLQVLAGRNLDLGAGLNRNDGTGVGITSVGNARNLNLPFEGASIIVGAGIESTGTLAESDLNFSAFAQEILTPANLERYLPELKASQNLGRIPFDQMTNEEQAAVALDVFYLVLRDAGRDYNDETKDGFGNYESGFKAIKTLFGEARNLGDINTQSRDLRTRSGGQIQVLAPGGKVSLAPRTTESSLIPPGIVTEAGGSISAFTDGDVDIGVSRIFTLRGGDIVIWSSQGDIAAGSSAKTVKSAPPTRVLIDPQSADVKTDLAGLATGGGIGVLATLADVEPGNVDLIAPNGAVDAGDAGIRSSGNLNIAAQVVLNAGNIQAGGTNTGGNVAVPAAPNVAGLTSASNASGAASNSSAEMAKQSFAQNQLPVDTPSIITVEVLGYGGDENGG